MKKFSFLLNIFFIFALSSCAIIPSFVEVKPVTLEEIVVVPNKNKIEIYAKARQWFTNYFISGESVIDYEDKESGTIIGKGIADNGSVNIVALSRLNYKVKVDTKDNKARIVVSLINYDIKVGDDPYKKNSNMVTAKNQETAKATMEKTLSDLKEYLLSEEDSTDW